MNKIDATKVITSMMPLFLAALWWVISSINDIHTEIGQIKSSLAVLITPTGEIIPSPGNQFARLALKEEMLNEINDLKIRVKLLESTP